MDWLGKRFFFFFACFLFSVQSSERLTVREITETLQQNLSAHLIDCLILQRASEATAAPPTHRQNGWRRRERKVGVWLGRWLDLCESRRSRESITRIQGQEEKRQCFSVYLHVGNETSDIVVHLFYKKSGLDKCHNKTIAVKLESYCPWGEIIFYSAPYSSFGIITRTNTHARQDKMNWHKRRHRAVQGLMQVFF